MSSIIYANGRVSAKINSLVGTERLNRMIETDSPEDAFKILSETGFGGDLSAGVVCFEKSLSYELAQLDSFIRDVCPSENLKRFLLYKNDFHNAEALIKCKFLKTDEKSLLVQDGIFRAAEMKERIFSDDYKCFPLNMALALAECDEKFVSGSADGVFVNNAIEKAYFADLYETAKKQPLLLKLYKAKADCANVQIALRCRDYKTAEKIFVKNGVISGDMVKKNPDGTTSAVLSFKDGVYQGKQTGYYDNGVVKYVLQTASGEQKQGDELAYDEYGRLRADKVSGTLTIFYEDGLKQAVLPYKKGVVNGTVKLFHPQYEVIDEEAEVKDGKLNGTFKKYDDGGLLIYETTYQDDVIADNVIMYYENGKPLVEFSYQNGVLNGETVGYYKSGKKFYSAEFKNNLRNGWQRYYYENGNTAVESFYENGVWNAKDYKEYDENGNLLIKIENNGYGTKYLRFENDEAIALNEEEKAQLMQRIDEREKEQELANSMSKKTPKVRRFF